MNAFGIDVEGLDVEAFLLWAHRLYPVLALLWIGALLRVRRPGWLFGGVLLANAWVFCVTHYPLRQIYALSISPDRLNQMGMVQVTATGHSLLIGRHVGQLHFEPFWSVFVGALSGWSPDRVLVLYPFLPLATVLGFAASLYFALRPGPGVGEWSPWERALIAGSATLLASAPLEYGGIYRVPWVLMFLLKPNHALGLVLLPWLLRSFAGIRSWRGRLAAGFLLHLLGWVFVVHMVYVAAGLVCFALGAWLWRREEARRDTTDAAAAIGLNLLIVSPYILMLLIDYPILQLHAAFGVPEESAHIAEGTLRHTPLLLLGAWGAWIAARRDRLGRVWAAVFAAGLLIWLACPVIGYLQYARELDEIYYWVRFTTAAMAGVGLWDLGKRVPSLFGQAAPSEARRAALVAALALPFTLPAWWNPSLMDVYFRGSLEPLDQQIQVPNAFIRAETPREAVFAGDPFYCRWVAALGARRGLMLRTRVPRDTAVRLEYAELLVTGADPDRRRELAPRWGVTHLIVTPAYLELFPGASLDALEARDDLEPIYHYREPGKDVAIFRLRPESP